MGFYWGLNKVLISFYYSFNGVLMRSASVRILTRLDTLVAARALRRAGGSDGAPKVRGPAFAKNLAAPKVFNVVSIVLFLREALFGFF
jgi:hypothetical protein